GEGPTRKGKSRRPGGLARSRNYRQRPARGSTQPAAPPRRARAVRRLERPRPLPDREQELLEVALELGQCLVGVLFRPAADLLTLVHCLGLDLLGARLRLADERMLLHLLDRALLGLANDLLRAGFGFGHDAVVLGV